MHYPVMTEKQLATRWKISVKTLRRWRLDKIGPVWHKLFRYVRYQEDAILEFERQSAQHWMTIFGRNEQTPIILTQPAQAGSSHHDADGEPGTQYVPAKEIAAITGLPIHLFGDREERDRKRIPYLSLVGNVRYAIDEILRWEMANSVPGSGPESAAPAADVAIEDVSPKAPDRVPRWYEIVSEQVGKPFAASNAVNEAANLRIGQSEMGGNERQNGCAQRPR